MRKDAGCISKEVAEYVTEFQQENICLNEPSKPPKSHWSPPRCGWYKINVNGAVFKESGSCGVGVVIRNEDGLLMGAMSQAGGAAAKGTRCKGLGSAREIIIEGDTQVVIKALQNFEACPWPVQKVVEGSLQSLSCFKA